MTNSAVRQDVTACILCSRNCGLSVEIENNQFKKIKGDEQHHFSKVIFVRKPRDFSSIINNMLIA